MPKGKLITPLMRIREAYLEGIRTIEASAAECDACGELLPLDQVLPFFDSGSLHERLDAGSVVPDGECPKCGAFCYRI